MKDKPRKGRPRGADTQRLTVLVLPETKQLIENAAKSSRISAGKLIDQLFSRSQTAQPQ